MTWTIRSLLRTLTAALAIGIGSAAVAQPPPAPAEPLALVNARVIDVRTGTVSARTTVVLRQGRVESIGGAAPADVRVIDVKGRSLLPGLIDAHTHLASLDAARRALESGVTTVRSAGGGSYNDVALSVLASRGVIAGNGHGRRPLAPGRGDRGDRNRSRGRSHCDRWQSARRREPRRGRAAGDQQRPGRGEPVGFREDVERTVVGSAVMDGPDVAEEHDGWRCMT